MAPRAVITFSLLLPTTDINNRFLLRVFLRNKIQEGNIFNGNYSNIIISKKVILTFEILMNIF